MLNTKFFSRMFIAFLALSGSYTAYGSSVSDKEDEKDVRSQGLSGISADVLSAEDRFKKCFDAAQNGDAHAQFSLGDMYRYGRGIPQDLKETLRYYKLSADQGNARAQSSLGYMYYKGEGVSQDYGKALRYYTASMRQEPAFAQLALGEMFLAEGSPENLTSSFPYLKLSADQGNADLQCVIGNMYFYGEGVPQDFEAALRYYMLSADQQHMDAQFSLGTMYYKGEGVPQDFEAALRYYKLSADQGNPHAQSNLGGMYYKGEGVLRNLEEGLRYYKLSADQGNSNAQFSLGLIYRYGDGVPQDLNEAFRYFKLLADQGRVDVQSIVAGMYLYGQGVSKDLKEAFRYYKLSADQGDAYAQYVLSEIYHKGEGTKADFEKAGYYLRLSADNNNPAAQVHLGKAYLEGEESSRDVEKGLYYLQLSANQGDAHAQYTLGKMYYSGESVEKDFEKAADYLRLSAKQKNYDADELLEKVAPLMRPKAQKLLLDSKNNPELMKILVGIRSNKIEESNQNHIRTHMVYWINLKEMTGRKLFEAGNKFRTTNPQYAADCYQEASDKGMKAAKTELQRIRKGQNYHISFSFFEAKQPSPLPKSVEYYIAMADVLEKERKLEESAALKTTARSTAPRSSTQSQPLSQDKKKTESSSTRQTAVEAGKNKKKRVARESEQGHGPLAKPAPLVGLGSGSSANRENDPKRQSPRGHFSLTGGLSRQEAALAAPVLSLTPVVAPSYGVRAVNTTTTTTIPQEEVRTIDEPEKKEKRTLRLKNPMKRGVLYAMFKGQTREEKEARRRENRKSRILGEGLLTPEEDVTTSLTPSLLESQSHFSITESEFDVEESYLSQSEAELDGVEGYVKFYYKPLWRLIHKSRATFLDQVKIKSSSSIRSVLRLMKEKQLITGTVNRGNIHVAKVGDQSTVFVAHTTHGSGAHARWYEDPAVVVDILTFWAKSDSNVKLFLESHFGENCFSRDIGGDDVDGTTSPEPK